MRKMCSSLWADGKEMLERKLKIKKERTIEGLKMIPCIIPLKIDFQKGNLTVCIFIKHCQVTHQQESMETIIVYKCILRKWAECDSDHKVLLGSEERVIFAFYRRKGRVEMRVNVEV